MGCVCAPWGSKLWDSQWSQCLTGHCTLQMPLLHSHRLWRCAAQTCASLVCPGSFIDFAIILRLSAFPVSPSESPQELREPGAAFPYLLLAMRVSSQGFQLSAPSILSQGWVSLMPGYGQTSDPGLH